MFSSILCYKVVDFCQTIAVFTVFFCISQFVSLFLIVVIFLPILLALYYLVKLCMSCSQYYKGNDAYFVESRKRAGTKMDDMMLRVVSRRNIIDLDDDDDSKNGRTSTVNDDNAGDRSVGGGRPLRVSGASMSGRRSTGGGRATAGRDVYGGYWNDPYPNDAKVDKMIEMAQMKKERRAAAGAGGAAATMADDNGEREDSESSIGLRRD